MARTDLSSWTILWQALGARGAPSRWHERLIGAYQERARHYHTVQHLEECLREFDRVYGLAQQPVLVETALWFHDAVYDSHSTTNEEDSARFAVECLVGVGVDAASVETVRQLIVTTKTHEPEDIVDAALLVDIDLAILGQPSERFWAYERAIRAEYDWVAASTFAAERAKVLTRFLQRPSIYRTTPFRVKYEAAARANLRAAVERLGQAPSPS